MLSLNLKRRAVELVLSEEWVQKSDRWIARVCRVSPTFVGSVRCQVSTWTPTDTRQGQDVVGGSRRESPSLPAPRLTEARKLARISERSAAEVNVWIRRRLGELLDARESQQGKRTDLEPADTMSASAPTLADLGVSYKQSECWQRIAGLSEEESQGYLDRSRRLQEPATQAGSGARGRQAAELRQ